MILGTPVYITKTKKCPKQAKEIRRLKDAMQKALMHLDANIDADGQCMKDSDAANALRSALANVAISQPDAKPTNT